MRVGEPAKEYERVKNAAKVHIWKGSELFTGTNQRRVILDQDKSTLYSRFIGFPNGTGCKGIYFFSRFTLFHSNISTSVADPGCLSRIPDPGSWFLPIPDPGSRIPDPKTATKDRCEKKNFVKPYFVATNFTTLNIILFFICWRKKFGPIFQELLKFLPKKLSPSPQ